MDSNTFHLSVKSEAAAKLLDATKSIRIRDQVLSISNVGKQVISIKLHWLPAYIRDVFIEDFFSGFGTVLEVTREAAVINGDITRRNGVRVLQLETDEVRKAKIPYLVTFAGGQSMLITFPGRQPLCLRCKTLGHVRRDCVAELPARRSYAGAVARGGDSAGIHGNSGVAGSPSQASSGSSGAVGGPEPVQPSVVPDPVPTPVPAEKRQRDEDDDGQGDVSGDDDDSGNLVIDESMEGLEGMDYVIKNGKKVRTTQVSPTPTSSSS